MKATRHAMRIISTALLMLVTQTLLGGLLFSLVARMLVACRSRRRWIAAWSGGARSLARAAPWAAALWLALVGLAAAPAGLAAGAAATWASPGWFAFLGAWPGAACLVLLRAGADESRGRLRRARRQARLAGELIFAGSLALLILVWAGLLFQAPLRRALVAETRLSGVVLLTGMLCLGFSGFLGVTAGLAGKPRPSSWFVSAAYAAGVMALSGAYQLTLGAAAR